MKVRYTSAIASRVGRTVDVTDAAARRLIDQGLAEEAGTSTQSTPTAPAQSATKAEWVDYAVSQGAERDVAEGHTKAELIEEYGTA